MSGERKNYSEVIGPYSNIPRDERKKFSLGYNVNEVWYNPRTGERLESVYTVADEFEAQCLDINYLTAPETTPEEIDGVLEGELQGYQLHFRDPKDSSIAEKLDVEKPLKPQTARFAGYISLLNEYQGQENHHASLINQAAQARNIQLEEIQQKVNHKELKKYQAEAHKIEAERIYRIQAQIHGEHITTLGKVKSNILRKFVMEQFSPIASSDEYLLNPDSIRDIVEDYQDNETFTSQAHVFIDQAIQFMKNTNDRHLYSTYSYKEKGALIRNLEEAKVLENVLRLAYNPTPFGSFALNTRYHELGKAFLSFTTKQALIKSNRYGAFSENFSLLSFAYDILNVTQAIKNPAFSENIGTILEKVLGDAMVSPQARVEMQALTRLYANRLTTLFENNISDLEKITAHKVPVPQDFVKFFLSDCFRMTSGFEMYAPPNKLVNSAVPWKKEEHIQQFFERFSVIRNQAMAKLRSKYAKYVGGRSLYLLADGVNAPAGISLDLADTGFMSSDLSKFITVKEGKTTLPPQAPDWLKKRFELIDSFDPEKMRFSSVLRILEQVEPPGRSLDEFESGILYSYNVWHFNDIEKQTNSEYTRALHTENDQLWFDVKHKSKWFISPRGDQFRAEFDRELHNLEIESVTFNIDRQYPREHSVELMLEGVSKPIMLWLDTNNRLLDRNHQLLDAPAFLKLELTNLLLKRLNYITSGILADQPNRKRYEITPWDGPDFTYSRACYVTLSDPRYTMTSDSALIHADEILEDYNINIWEVMQERRDLKLIEEWQYLTFRRESEPLVKPEGKIPSNIIIYKPELAIIRENQRHNPTRH